MGALELVLRLAGGVLLIGANAFFVSVEFALTRLRGLDLSDEEISSGGLKTAWELTERLEIHLTGCQLGISSTSVVLGIVAEPGVTALIEPVVGLVGVEGGAVRGVSVVVAVVILNLVHKIWGEQAPTYLGVERPKQVARRLAPILKVWSALMKPFIRLGDGAAKATLGIFGVEITRSWQEAETGAGDEGSAPSSRSELTDRMAQLLASEVVPEDREEEILQALRIDEIACREIMVPPSRVAWLSLQESPREWCDRIAERGHTRYPVLETRHDADETVWRGDVSGLLYVPALFRLDTSPCGDGAGNGSQDGQAEGRAGRRAVLADPLYLAADTAVSRLIDELQEAGQEMALLVDDETGAAGASGDGGEPAAGQHSRDSGRPDGAEGEVVGIVTVSDAFEAIAGDLTDPLDRKPRR